MKRKLDMDRIAKGLGAERRGKVSATGGYFGAMQLLADVEAKFRVPAGGGRPTDPRWTERRLVPLALETLERLEDITARVRKHGGVNVEPMQLAALLLERTTRQLSEAEAEKLIRPREAAGQASCASRRSLSARNWRCSKFSNRDGIVQLAHRLRSEGNEIAQLN